MISQSEVQRIGQMKGETFPTPGIPESLNVLLHELQGLALSITLE